MKRIHFAGREILTGDRIADAVTDYAAVLAGRVRADRVDIPAAVGGRIQRMTLVLGPASQILVEPADNGFDDPIDEELILELGRRTTLLGLPRPVVTSGLADFRATDIDPRDDRFE